MFLGTSWLLSILPSSSFNIPNRDYWLNEENRPKTIQRVSGFLVSMGFYTMLFFLAVQWKVFRANQVVPPKSDLTLLLYGGIILVAIITVETVHLCLAFRLPKGNG